MRILGLWLDNYISGTATERFKKPIESMGHFLDVLDLNSPNLDSELLKRVNDYNLLIHLPYRSFIRPEIIRHISKNTDLITLLWNGDDEWQSISKYENSIELSNNYNYTVTTWRQGFENGIYKVSNSKVIPAQWGYSSQDWKPNKRKKDIDIYFCGSRTANRDFYLRHLKDEGFNVVIEGPGYSDKIPLKKMIGNYQRAKIALSFIKDVKRGFEYSQIKARTFEIPATGTFHLSEYCPELKRYFKIGKEIETFNNPDELISKCRKYLKDSTGREKIAHEGFLANKKNSYSNIFKQIFKEIDFEV